MEKESNSPTSGEKFVHAAIHSEAAAEFAGKKCLLSNAIYGKKHKDNSSFALYGIDRDEPLKRVHAFAKQTGVTYPLGLDPGANIFALYAERNAGITRNVLIGKDGKIVMMTCL